ncbi:MAG: acetate--CoA ligase family protein [Chloroflexi bacterium]|nr:acetate--CoA ligase family protein [Chloroflexota bacterium]
MARLFEHEGKRFLADAGIAVPRGGVASTPKEAYDVARRMGKPVVVKAQVWAGGRGKAGAVRFADTPEEAENLAGAILGMEVGRFPVRTVLVEEKLDIEKEYYVGVIPDFSRHVRSPVVIFSTEGGMNIEDVPQDKILKSRIDYAKGLPLYDALDMASSAGVPNKSLQEVARVTARTVDVFKKYDCRILEINPLILTRDGKVIAGDCRMGIDDNAVFRHPEMGITIPREFPWEPTEFDVVGWGIDETDFRGSGFAMKMTVDEVSPGFIGFHAIGGGAAMVGMDALSRVGLKPANFADTSGNPVASKVYRVAKLVLSQPNIEGYLLAGFIIANQEQWHHAHGIVRALREELPNRPGFPCVLLLAGNKEEESLQILREGLGGLPGRIEIYGSDRVEDSDFVGGRMLALVEEYRKEKAR